MIWKKTPPTLASAYLVLDLWQGTNWTVPEGAFHAADFQNKFGHYEFLPSLDCNWFSGNRTRDAEMAKNPLLLKEARKYQQKYPDYFKTVREVMEWAGLYSTLKIDDVLKQKKLLHKFAAVSQSTRGCTVWRINMCILSKRIVGPICNADELMPVRLFHKVDRLPGWDDKAVQWTSDDPRLDTSPYAPCMLWRQDSRSFVYKASRLIFVKNCHAPITDLVRVAFSDGPPDVLEVILKKAAGVVSRRDKMMLGLPQLLERALLSFRVAQECPDYFLQKRLESSMVGITSELDLPTPNEINAITDILADLARSRRVGDRAIMAELMSLLVEHKFTRRQIISSPIGSMTDDARTDERIRRMLGVNASELARLDNFVYALTGCEFTHLLHRQLLHLAGSRCRVCCTGPPEQEPGTRWAGHGITMLMIDWCKVNAALMKVIGYVPALQAAEKTELFVSYDCPGELFLTLRSMKWGPSGRRNSPLKHDGLFGQLKSYLAPTVAETFAGRVQLLSNVAFRRTQAASDVTTWAKIPVTVETHELCREEIHSIDLSSGAGGWNLMTKSS